MTYKVAKLSEGIIVPVKIPGPDDTLVPFVTKQNWKAKRKRDKLNYASKSKNYIIIAET